MIFFFPQPGDDWYSYCPDCSGYSNDCDPAPSICRLFIVNEHAPYVWGFSGYIENFMVSEQDSRFCYFAYDTTWPIAHPDEKEILIDIIRPGAHQPEWNTDNYAAFFMEYKGLWSPHTYILNWAANLDVVGENVESFDDAAAEAGERARRQQTENPAGSNDFIGRYYDVHDRNTSLHLESNRVTTLPAGLQVPTHLNLCTTDYGCNNCTPYGCEDCTTYNCIQYLNYRDMLKSFGVNVLVVQYIKYCTGCWENEPLICSDTEFDCEKWGFGYLNEAFMAVSTASNDLPHTILHELGHNCGLDHNVIDYNVMGTSDEENNDVKRGSDIHEYQRGAFWVSNPYPQP